ncbi:MAG TPA: DUF2141 domain-containing protein [Polyangiaceae bacterium]|nr:DUF2141 domain-containing protein [Polyangiaceae bacterium]
MRQDSSKRSTRRRCALNGLLLTAFGLLATQAQAGAGGLTVRVFGLRNRTGTLQLALFRTARGYPEEIAKATLTRSIPLAHFESLVSWPQVGAGTWALSVLHDENSNGRLDRNFIGVPTEGIGASNDAVTRWGPPTFEDAKFQCSTDGCALDIHLRYWL